jgi:hypothetical protein
VRPGVREVRGGGLADRGANGGRRARDPLHETAHAARAYEALGFVRTGDYALLIV